MRAIERILRWRRALAGGQSAPAWKKSALSLDFLSQRYFVALASKNFSDIITFTRASSATRFNASGALESISANQPRFSHDPVSLRPLGILVEEQRTNSIRNNMMVGAVVGNPGTLPTNWYAATSNGLSSSVVGVGQESGINYIDVRIYGTTNAASAAVTLMFDNSLVAPALSGQLWDASAFLSLQSGAYPTYAQLYVYEFSSGGGQLAQSSVSISGGGALASKRYEVARTFNNASTAFAKTGLYFQAPASGTVVDFTIRVGMPQLEQGAFATSVIPTTTAQATRAADSAIISTLTPWFNASEGSIVVEGCTFDTVSARPCLVSFDDNTGNNRIQLRRNNAGPFQINGIVVAGNVTQASIGKSANSWTDSGVKKSSLGYKLNGFNGAFNGGLFDAPDTSGTVPTISQVVIGGGITAGVNYINGYIRKLSYYPQRLTDAQLQALTA